MKKLLLLYVLLSLVVVAVLSVLSYEPGAGYVYMLWRGVQIQSNLWVLVFVSILLSFMLHVAWIGLQYYLARERRKQQHVLNFEDLHPYEQLGLIWILHGDEEQQAFIEQVFNQSGLLKQIVQAHLLFKQSQYSQALSILDEAPAAAFELAEIQRIEIYLAQHDAHQALTHLEFLNGHQLSPCLSQIHQAYQTRIAELWADFALQFPWLYLQANPSSSTLRAEAMQAWLTQMLTQFEQADDEALQHLKQHYNQNQIAIRSLVFEIQVLWLKILSRLTDMSEAHEKLALHLLNLRFDQEVFNLWFQQQLLNPEPDYFLIEQYIQTLESRYPSMPVLSFAKWHIFTATHREEEAEQLLLLYPDNILMNYLRIKSTLKGQEDLIKQLNLVFENDVKFMKFKI